MKNYRITLQYDGTKYRGWQSQKNTEKTIQGKLEMVLESLVHKKVEVIGSGRTDAGVHAYGQVANFQMDTELSTEELLQYLNRYLPEDIAVLEVQEAPERFHSRYHAIRKTYRYRIHNDAIPNVFERKYVYVYEKPLDLLRMRKAVEYLIGTHDFSAFCGNRNRKKSKVRTIYSIILTRETNGEIRIDYTGDGFLHNMVRIMTGTLIEVGNGTREPEEIKEILKSKDRSNAGYTAPAQGLTLMQVNYDE